MSKITKHKSFSNKLFSGILFWMILSTPTIAEAKSNEVEQLINRFRAENNLSTLKFNLELAKSANDRIIDMATQHYFSHTNPQGEGLAYFLSQTDYRYTQAGEIMAINIDSLEKTMTSWINSPQHKKALLNPNYSEYGYRLSTIELDGEEYPITVIIFGNR